MITFIAVMVFINFILICVNEYGALNRAKNTIEIMHKYKSETEEMISRIEDRLDASAIRKD